LKYIEHIIEPDRLLLSWQPPSGPDRLRRFVAALVRKADDADLVYLVDTEDFRLAQEKGFSDYPGFPADVREHEGVLSAFLKRLPPRTRRDFGVFLNAIRITERDRELISDFALLGYSGAKLPDDDFTIVHPFSTAQPPFEFLLNVQGYRYYAKNLPYDRLAIDMAAHFEAELENAQDPEAIRVMIEGSKVGYVSRGLATQLKQWIQRGYAITASLERINGTAEKPSILLFVTVRNTVSGQ